MSLKVGSSAGATPLLKNVGNAPFVYFDGIPVYGTFAGNLELELAARVLMPKPDGSVIVDMSCAAHLRCSPNAALALIDALQKAIKMHADQQKLARESDPTTN